MEKLTFELSIEDAAIVVARISDIIEKGVSAKEAPAFRRLGKALQRPVLTKKKGSQ